MRKQTKLWKMKNGEKIRICDMGDSHLLNAIRMLERYAECFRLREVAEFYAYPAPTSDNALDCWEGAERELAEKSWTDYLYPSLYDELLLDALRRELPVPEFILGDVRTWTAHCPKCGRAVMYHGIYEGEQKFCEECDEDAEEDQLEAGAAFFADEGDK